MSFSNEYFPSLWTAFRYPADLYDKAAQESGVARGFRFTMISMLLSGASLALLFEISSPSTLRTMFSVPIQGPVLEWLARIRPSGLLVVLMPMYGILITFAAAALLHASAKLFHGAGDFPASYRILAYATAPAILAWIPVLGILAGIYQAGLLIVGVVKLHRLPVGTAILAWLIPASLAGVVLKLLLQRL